MKKHWKFMLPRKKWYTWTVLLRLVFLDNEYSSEVFQTLLVVSHLSNVARKCQKQSSRGVLWKTCFWKFRKSKVLSCEFCQIFKNTFFHRTSPVAVSVSEAVVRRCSVKKVFLEILINSQENTCARVSFLQPWECKLIKIKSLNRLFLVNFANNFLRTLFYRSHRVYDTLL